MTGFGEGFAQGGGLRVDVEISSVNRKQLDVLVNLPKPWSSLEPWVSEQISHSMSRGRVQVQITMRSTGAHPAGSITIDQALAAKCVQSLRSTAKKLGLRDEISISDLLRVPGILVVHDAGEKLDLIKPVVAKAMARALKNFSAMRKREGLTLGRDLLRRIDHMAQQVEVIAARAPGLVEHFRAMLQSRIRNLASGLDISDERIEKEVVVFADRADITEELTRLRSHLDQARDMLKQKEPAGRSLDFLAQEMFREINTIASKASDAVISGVVVHFKAELERLREQVQNIE